VNVTASIFSSLFPVKAKELNFVSQEKVGAVAVTSQKSTWRWKSHRHLRIQTAYRHVLPALFASLVLLLAAATKKEKKRRSLHLEGQH
jgi:hypothetical protein